MDANQLGKEPILFNDSIFQNVANGLHNHRGSALTQHRTRELVYQACKDANIHDFISQLPQGYETMLEDRGSSISGGEKQWIAIARAIISNPPILLLDKATSALDANSEVLVQAILDKLSINRTIVVISHKLATIQKADKIVIIKNNRAVEEGIHAALSNQGGIYQSLVEAQDLKSPDMKTDGTEDFEDSDPQISDVDAHVTCDEKSPMNNTRTEI